MKILIVGKDSYIGNHIDEWLTKSGHKVEQLDAIGEGWKSFDYSSFDSIVLVASIVHRPDCKDWELFKKVNTDLPIQVATLAKQQGVKQFVFFSSMAVYGIGKALSPNIVTKESKLHSESMYGKSKLMAEIELAKMQDENFNVAFVRPPSVYGKGCKGNYISRFAMVARKMPIVPRTYEDVKQSFVYIDNLCECIRIIVENKLSGPFCPQDDKSVNTNELLDAIAAGWGKKCHSSKVLGWFVHLITFLPIVKKAYGGMEYAREVSEIPGFDYVVVPFDEGMKRTVN